MGVLGPLLRAHAALLHLPLACQALQYNAECYVQPGPLQAADPTTLLLHLRPDCSSVRAFADAFRSRHSSLHLLLNNAGEFHPGPFALTADGLERTLAPNYWGHFYLSHCLLDLLVGGCWAAGLAGPLLRCCWAGWGLGCAAAQLPGHRAVARRMYSPRTLRPLQVSSAPSRIVNTVSEAEMFGKLDWDDLKWVAPSRLRRLPASVQSAWPFQPPRPVFAAAERAALTSRTAPEPA